MKEDLPRFAVVGRPNAGKSSFINALIGEERYIVTDIAGIPVTVSIPNTTALVLNLIWSIRREFVARKSQRRYRVLFGHALGACH